MVQTTDQSMTDVTGEIVSIKPNFATAAGVQNRKVEDVEDKAEAEVAKNIVEHRHGRFRCRGTAEELKQLTTEQAENVTKQAVNLLLYRQEARLEIEKARG